MKNKLLTVIIGNLIFVAATAMAEGDAIQTPAIVQMELQKYQDHFATILQDECPGQLCSLVGCEAVGFLTLDQQQNASLPGLESEENAKNPQYKLSNVRCEFTFESTINEKDLNSLRQRILAKSKLAGTSLNLIARKLIPKATSLMIGQDANAADQKSDLKGDNAKSPMSESRWSQLAPWMFFAALLTLLSLLMIWGYRRIGKPKPLAVNPEGEIKVVVPEPSAQMIMSRIQHLKEKLNTTNLLTLALKPLMQKSELKILCQVLRHFGPDALIGFNDKIEYRDTLLKLREAYQNFTDEESNSEVWQFLDKIERYIVASEVGTEENSLAEEFLFLQNLEASEFFHLLKSVGEEDVALILSFAPSPLQNTFFKQLDSEQLVVLIEQITRTKDLSDKSVREKAKAIREIYQNRRAELKTISLDRLPILEQLLNSMEGEKRTVLLNEMRSQNTHLFQTLLGQMFMDKSLTLMSKETLNEIFVSVAPEKAASYLDSLPFREEVLKRLNPVLANSIRRYSRAQASENLGLNLSGNDAFFESSLENSENGSARNEIVKSVREQVQKGSINLRTINENLLQTN